ncbi:hypothetical protein [Tellurirhabdus bombi]|uniref:hypothetical protein n=1 Tax=Tellurirhabdus bombi TaxID=2907205 RepID=UPI001F2024DC|nr:hypothetical protein [Tellurirhabdus bombi]
MIRQLITSLARRAQIRTDRFGLKEWVLLVHFLILPFVWVQCIDGFEFAWHLLQVLTTFATADLAEHVIAALQNQGDTDKIKPRIIEWGLLITVVAAFILLAESAFYGL